MTKHPAWLSAALDYIPRWMAFQVERYRQTGCTVAIAQDQRLLAEFAFGQANLRTGETMTPRHRLRIASHSKTFTAAGVMLLRERGLVGLDDPIGRYVKGLHKGLAQARVSELLSHGAGVVRDGADSGQFTDHRPYLSRAELRAELARAQPLEPGVQLKYSNHGYGLLGLMIEEITGQTYGDWITRHVIEPPGLQETSPDMPAVAPGTPMARGHSAEYPFGQRLVIPGDNACNAIASAAGFVSTAADVARFFAQLDPLASQSILSAASRRDMLQRRWRDDNNVLESHYGLGTMMSGPGPKEWFGHTGSLQGFVSRTARFTGSGFTITVLCNANDSWSWPWADAIDNILTTFRQHGAPTRQAAAWTGRWWSIHGATDLVPMGQIVKAISPALHPPFTAGDTDLQPIGRLRARIAKTSAYQSPGQDARLVLGDDQQPVELWIAGSKQLPLQALLDEAKGRYRSAKRLPFGPTPKRSS